MCHLDHKWQIIRKRALYVGIGLLAVGAFIIAGFVLFKYFIHFRIGANINENNKHVAFNAGMDSMSRRFTNNSYWNYYKLPNNIDKASIKYNITLYLTTENITTSNTTETLSSFNPFYGYVRIKFILKEATNFLILHKNLSIIKKSIFNSNDGNIYYNITNKIKEIIYNERYQHWIIALNETISNYTYIDVYYKGFITSTRIGILKSLYYDIKNKETHLLLYTKIEPNGARNIFPCFDEINFKAIYSINIIHESDKLSLSNMPIISQENINNTNDILSILEIKINKNMTLTKFEQTPIVMSTYLLAFVILDNYTRSEVERKPGYKVRIFYPKFTNFPLNESLEIARRAENEMEIYFNLTNPFPKSDHLYIPNFVTSAMENWGLMTYSDNNLLVKDDIRHEGERPNLDTLIHEISHIYFGNFVTSNWWDEIWIHESFATYFAGYFYRKLSSIPSNDLEAWDSYISRIIINFDLINIPIIKKTIIPADYGKNFDVYNYFKGRALITWMHDILGEEPFHEWIKLFIKNYKTKNTNTYELFNMATNFTNINMSEMFYPWLSQGSYPLINVDYDENDGIITLTQQPLENLTNSSNLLWPVSVTYKTSNLNSTRIYFNNSLTIKLKLNDSNDYFILNHNGKAYLRVKYSNNLLQRIINTLENKTIEISQITKSILIDDYIFFIINNKTDIQDGINLIKTLKDDTNFLPWHLLYSRLHKHLNQLVPNLNNYSKWRNFVIKSSNVSCDNIIKTAKFNLNNIQQFYQFNMLKMNLELDNNNINKWINIQFNNFMVNLKIEQLPQHLIGIILHYGLKNNDNYNNWKKLWKLLNDSMVKGDNKDLEFQLKIGLIGTNKSYLINRVLNLYLKNMTHISSTAKMEEFFQLTKWLRQSLDDEFKLLQWTKLNVDNINEFIFNEIDLNYYKEEYFRFFCRLTTVTNIKLNLDIDCKPFIMMGKLWINNFGKVFLKLL